METGLEPAVAAAQQLADRCEVCMVSASAGVTLVLSHAAIIIVFTLRSPTPLQRLRRITAAPFSAAKQMRLQPLSKAVNAVLSRNGADILFQTRGRATAKLLSPNLVLVRGTTHVRASADRRRRSTSATNRLYDR